MVMLGVYSSYRDSTGDIIEDWCDIIFRVQEKTLVYVLLIMRRLRSLGYAQLYIIAQIGHRISESGASSWYQNTNLHCLLKLLIGRW